MTPGADPLINLIVDGRYRVLRRMARGGMASVYVAHDERLDRPVALKVMHPHLAESEQFTARFRQEARSAARISHSGVVPVYDQGAFHGQGYLVMELVDGPDLRTYIRANGPLTLGMALDFAEQILTALSAAHQVGVVHRDLKPENILVSSDGTLKIVDFGLARAASEITLSSTGSILGTVAYLAPEVALRGSTDGRTDIFAVGIMLYEVLTGAVPSSDVLNPVQMALQRVNEDVPPPSLTTTWLPIEVDNLVASFCSREASERPVSAHDAANQLRQLKSVLTEEDLERELPLPHGARPETESDARTGTINRYARTSLLPVEPKMVHTSGSVVAPDKKQFPPSSKKPVILVMVLLLLIGMGLGVWWWWQEYGPGSYITVPELAGKSVAQTEEMVQDLNLASNFDYEFDDTIPEDIVISTDPSAGEQIHKRGEIRILVSKGIKMVTVPVVNGQPLRDALDKLADDNLSVGDQKEEWSETIDKGSVISTSPKGGSSVPHYEEIDIVVSKGRQPITVPDLLGQLAEDAVSKIKELGLKLTQNEIFSSDVEKGKVASQDPEPQATLYRGDEVKVNVSKGPEYIEVPNVYGRSRVEAIDMLEEAGFEVDVSVLAGFFDQVGSQSPRAGEMAVRGSLVKITVV